MRNKKVMKKKENKFIVIKKKNKLNYLIVFSNNIFKYFSQNIYNHF